MAERGAPEWLLRLPEVDPPVTLWPRVEAARRRRLRRRVWVPMLAASMAMVGLVFVVLMAPPSPPTLVATDLVALIEDNRRLVEALHTRQLQASRLTGWQEQRIRSLEIDLSLLDRKLQERYVHTGSNADLEALWRARAGLLSSLIETYERPHDIRRV